MKNRPSVLVDPQQGIRAAKLWRPEPACIADEGVVSSRRRLFRYLFAGGMRQTRRTAIEDDAARRTRRFGVFLIALLIFWLVFRMVPCV